MAIPNLCRLSIITNVSRLSRTPVRCEVPSANAAITSARLVRLLEPGGRIVPDTGRSTGKISRTSVISFVTVRKVCRLEAARDNTFRAICQPRRHRDKTACVWSRKRVPHRANQLTADGRTESVHRSGVFRSDRSGDDFLNDTCRFDPC